MKILKWLKRICFGFFAFVLVSMLVWITILRMNYVVPILMYHSVVSETGSKNRLTVDLKYFEKQMKFLHDANYNLVYVYEIAEMIKNKKRIPPKTVAITFDDGLKDDFTVAFPILKKYDIPATMFIIVDYVDKNAEYMTLDQLKILSNSGIEIGSHTMSHLWLINTNDQMSWRKEIVGSKQALESMLGKEIKSFSYPGGAFNQKIKEIVKEAGYKCAVATSPGPSFPKDDIYALKRLRISNTSNSMFVFWFKLTGSYLFIKERRDDY